MRQALVCGLLTFALAQANPTIKSPSRLAKRGGPNPSHYPGKDTPECANEPLYLNFDISQKTDKDRVQKIHDVFCNEVDLLMIAGQTATQDQDRTLYKRYLPENDDEDKYEAFTEDIWNKLFDFNAQTPSKLVSTFIIDNKDWKGSCPESGGTDLIDDSDTLDEAAYTGVDKEDNDREKTHICAAALEYIPLADITCDTLDSYPSVQMESAGRLMLHEFLHYSTVGPDSLLKDQIGDSQNGDSTPENPKVAYFPSRTHGLIDPKQDNQPALAAINADSYAWLSTNSFFKQKCPEGPNKGNYNDPPNYKKGQSGDPSSSGKGDNPGDNGCGSSNAPGCNGTPSDADPYA